MNSDDNNNNNSDRMADRLTGKAVTRDRTDRFRNTFPPVTLNSCLVTLTVELDRDSFKMKLQARCLGERSSSS